MLRVVRSDCAFVSRMRRRRGGTHHERLAPGIEQASRTRASEPCQLEIRDRRPRLLAPPNLGNYSRCPRVLPPDFYVSQSRRLAQDREEGIVHASEKEFREPGSESRHWSVSTEFDAAEEELGQGRGAGKGGEEGGTEDGGFEGRVFADLFFGEEDQGERFEARERVDRVR